MSQLGLLHRKDTYEGPGESGFVYTLEKVDYNMIMQVLGNSTPVGLGEDAHNLVPSELMTAFDNLASKEQDQTTVDSWD